MTWWVLTLLENTRAWNSLKVLSHTNRPDHLFMSWSHYKPSRTRVYRSVRGATIWCGYKYTWDTPNVVEQNEPSDTLEHTLGLIPLDPTDHLWYYLWSIAGAYGQPCQGPLIHIPPPELPMPSARLFHSLPQPCGNAVMTILTFDSVLWDDGPFYDPGAPTKLTIPIAGLYSFGASARLVTAAPCEVSLQIRVNAGPANVYHSHVIGPTGWGGAGLSLHGIMRFQPGDSIECRVWHNAGAPRMIAAAPDYTPHFWIAQIGPYPT